MNNNRKAPLDICADCLFKTICLQSMSEEDFNFLYESTIQKSYQKDEVIFQQGEKSPFLVFLQKGLVKFNYLDTNNKNLILTIVSAPSLLGLANVLNEDINLFSIIAIEDSMGCQIDLNKVKVLAMKNKNFLISLTKLSTDMFRNSIYNVISLAHKQINGRIADILLFLARDIYHSNTFTLSISRQELAEFAGCSKENVIKSLRSLNRDNIIRISGKEIEILDIKKLIKISQKG
ncbi:MAG: Crp/Fnr family transcriptional regulator [Bacteroidales bacterium]|jgi:CRP-like cAMP-binding protein|nr:Crp/Fnr family transcriptional regulator [Bacteroidales bacterium]HNT70936.1 Crp/Fnr family transcriptional regulator [Bacteroidales bacterium]HNW21100.1 Crp/Fnr family transcriptional regulator [Bacteroidales bacterium]